jgi:hypothetical protein
MSMGIDAAGERVNRFQSEAHNLSRRAVLSELIIEMFESKDWRDYSNALGRERWRVCEFDYFLIASNISYEDAIKTFSWKEVGREVAKATESDDPRERRTLEKAAAAWHSPGPETLMQRAKRLGWIADSGEQLLKVASERARAYARHGTTMEEHTRTRRARQLKERRTDLDRVIADLVRRLPKEIELRYVIDGIEAYLQKYAKQHRHEEWARDIAKFDGDTKKLAKHWRIKKSAISRRISLLSRRDGKLKRVS